MGFAWPWLCLGWEAIFQGQLGEARELLAQSIAVSDELGLPITNGLANSFLTYAHLVTGNTELAYSLASTTLKRVQETGAGLISGMANHMLGATLLARGELAAARDHLETAVAIERRSGFVYALSWHLTLLGTLERVEAKLDAAQAHGEEALEVARGLDSGWLQAGAERLLGSLALATGAATDAERYIHHALDRLTAKGFTIDIPDCLDLLAAIAAIEESNKETARLFGAAAAARARLSIVRFPPEPKSWASVERTTREALGDDDYHAAFTAGAALDTDEAVAYVRRARGERKRPSHGWDSLTPTELEVVRHIAAGLTNRQIGERMFISLGTVKAHLAHIFTKLGILSRVQLAADATKHGLNSDS